MFTLAHIFASRSHHHRSRVRRLPSNRSMSTEQSQPSASFPDVLELVPLADIAHRPASPPPREAWAELSAALGQEGWKCEGAVVAALVCDVEAAVGAGQGLEHASVEAVVCVLGDSRLWKVGEGVVASACAVWLSAHHARCHCDPHPTTSVLDCDQCAEAAKRLRGVVNMQRLPLARFPPFPTPTPVVARDGGSGHSNWPKHADRDAREALEAWLVLRVAEGINPNNNNNSNGPLRRSPAWVQNHAHPAAHANTITGVVCLSSLGLPSMCVTTSLDSTLALWLLGPSSCGVVCTHTHAAGLSGACVVGGAVVVATWDGLLLVLSLGLSTRGRGTHGVSFRKGGAPNEARLQLLCSVPLCGGNGHTPLAPRRGHHHHKHAVSSVGTDGSDWVCCGHRDGGVSVVCATSWGVQRELDAHTDAVTFAAVVAHPTDPDRAIAVTAALDGSLCVHACAHNEPGCRVPLGSPALCGVVLRVGLGAFSTVCVVVGLANGSLCTVAPQQGSAPTATTGWQVVPLGVRAHAHNGPVHCMVVGGKGGKVVTSGGDGALRVWDWDNSQGWAEEQTVEFRASRPQPNGVNNHRVWASTLGVVGDAGDAVVGGMSDNALAVWTTCGASAQQ